MISALYERHVFPWLLDRLSRDRYLRGLRQKALAAARGRAVEIGFGTGLNLEFYPGEVSSLVAVEPNEGMFARAAQRIAGTRIRTDLIRGHGESLPIESSSCDTAVLMLTLCSVGDPDAVLRELRRVLRSGGQLIVFEHGLSEDARVAWWQERLNPIQRVIACGCNLNRPIAPLVENAGFRFHSLEKFYAPRLPRPYGWITLGAASVLHRRA